MELRLSVQALKELRPYAWHCGRFPQSEEGRRKYLLGDAMFVQLIKEE
jgi:hypothetical protein